MMPKHPTNSNEYTHKVSTFSSLFLTKIVQKKRSENLAPQIVATPTYASVLG